MEIKIGPSETLSLNERPPRLTGQRSAAGSTDPVSICLSERAFLAVHRHAASSDNEIGGILLGEAFTWQGQTYVEVEAALAGEMTKAGPAHVTFTAETWAKLLRQKEVEFAKKAIVGWYHSHPRMGIFLSGMDLTIQRHFFPQPWHVALVVNGQDLKAGFFAWQRGDISKVQCFDWLPHSPRDRQISLEQGRHPFNYQWHPVRERVAPEVPEVRPQRFLRSLLILFSAVMVLIFFKRLRERRRRVPDRGARRYRSGRETQRQ